MTPLGRITAVVASFVLVSVLGAGCSADLEVIRDEGSVATGSTPTPATTDDGSGPPEPTPSPDPDVPAPTPTPTVTVDEDLPYDEAIVASFADVEAYWAIQLPLVFGVEFTPVRDTIPYRPSRPETLPTCGGEQGPVEVYQGNAFYCPPDDIIAWDDEGLFPDLYGAFGDFALALVIAHEYGHAVQSRVGQDFGPTIFVELQADCLAGAWAGAVDRGESPTGLVLSPSDLEEAIGGYLTFADPIGTPTEDPAAHGSGFDRMRAFIDGFSTGPEVCVDYLTDPPDVATIPLLQDPNDGDLPLTELLPLLQSDLDSWWTAEAPGLIGVPWRAPTVVPFGDGVGPRPTCDGQAVPDDRAVGRGFYCVDDNVVAFDAGAFQRELFAQAGDMAASYVVLHLYGQSIAVAAGVDDPTEVVRRADCFAGVWLADVFEQTVTGTPTHDLLLSAGDLDEAVIGSVAWVPNGPSLQATDTVRAFDRIGRLTAGFFDGPRACG